MEKHGWNIRIRQLITGFETRPYVQITTARNQWNTSLAECQVTRPGHGTVLEAKVVDAEEGLLGEKNPARP